MVGETPGSPLEDAPCTSKSEICLLLDREANRQRLSEVLSKEYETIVSESIDGALNTSYSLYILDERAFSNHKERLKQIKDEDAPRFRPCLLVTTRHERELPQQVWDVVDDVLVVPTQPELLTKRVRNLIGRQRLSQQVVDERDRATSLFQRIFQNSNDAICIADIEHKQVRAGNQAAIDLYGYSDSNLESLHLSELYEDYDEFLSFVERVVEEGTGKTDDLRCTRNNGETFSVAISSSYVEINDTPHLINNIRDITDQKEREEERRKSEQYRQQLYEITSDTELSFDDKVEQVLELGRERLGVENGHLVQIDIDQGSHVVLATSGSHILRPGDKHELASTYCRKTIESESVLAVHNAPEQGWKDEPAFEKHGLASYASSRILIDGDIFGTVCFVDRSPRENPFNEREKTFVELIARWLSHELERREQTRILRDLHEVTVDLLETGTETGIADCVVAAVQELFDSDNAVVYLKRDGENILEPVSVSEGARQLFEDELPPATVGTGIIGQVFEGGKPSRIDDLEKSNHRSNHIPFRSVICLPLGTCGVLLLGSTSVDAFDETDREELELLATNATAALLRTERERQLREAHQHRSKLFENSTDCIVEIEFDGRTPIIQDVNSAFESVFGFDAEAVMGESLQRLIVPPDNESESDGIIERALRGEPFEAEVRRETANGRRDFIFRAIPIEEDGEVTGGYAVYTDITARRRQEQQVQVLNRVLRHNLRNKVNVINGQATRIQDQLDGSADEGLQAIIEASDDLLMLTEKTSQLRKANHQEIASDVVNIAVLIEEVVGEVQDDFSDATIEVNALEQAEVVGASLFKIAVREVIENAIKHSNSPEPTVRVAVTSESSSNGWVEITISDDGPGIPEIEEQVLEEGTETPLQHASGLGLWVVNWILKVLSGDFTIESSNSSGTKISFKLPKQNTAVLTTTSSQFEQQER